MILRTTESGWASFGSFGMRNYVHPFAYLSRTVLTYSTSCILINIMENTGMKKYLRPQAIEIEYGIKVPTLYKLFKHGLKSTVTRHNLKGRGVRMVKVTDLEAYFEAREVTG
jgi:hypothetical protein